MIPFSIINGKLDNFEQVFLIEGTKFFREVYSSYKVGSWLNKDLIS